jgi:hypothetical protein
MSRTDDRSVDLVDNLPTDDIVIDEPSSDLYNPDTEAMITPVPTSDLTTRIDDADGVSGDDQSVAVTDDNFVTSGDVAGDDVIDFGLSSDASLGGLGTNIDDLPGDETPISNR